MEIVKVIREWLGCSEEAGQRVWFQPTILSDAALFDVYKAKAVRKGREWTVRGLTIEYCDLESDATGAVLAIYDRLKSGDSTEDAYEFLSVGEFLAYLNVSVPGAMHDILHRRIRSFRGDPPPEVPEATEDPPYEPIRLREKGAVNEYVFLGPSPLAELQQRQKREVVTRLLVEFRDTLTHHSALQGHLDGVVEAHKEGIGVSNEEVAEEIVHFLNTTRTHRSHLRQWFEAQGISEDNYQQRNSRLRVAWRVFRDGSGKADYDAYGELA